MTRPSRVEVSRQLDAIEELVRLHPEGVKLSELQAVYDAAYGPLHPRTLARRLAELGAQRRVMVEGAARQTRYLPVSQAERTRPEPIAPRVELGGADTAAETPRVARALPPHPHGPLEGGAGRVPLGEQPPAPPLADDDDISLSAEGQEVRALVRRPLSEKPAVINYDEELLRGYRPGDTWYLPDATRARLHELGRTPVADRPAGTYARHNFERLLIDLSWASSRLEGNEYTRIDTKNLLERNVAAPGKTAKDAQMILNHRKAIELLVDQAEDVGFNRYTFCNLHAALSENLLGDPDDEGRLRRRPVAIHGTPYVPLDVPQKIEELFDVLLATAGAIPDPFEQAFFLMVHLPYLQPFADVNKRTSRLGANLPLIKANLSPLSFVGTSERAYVEGTLGVYENRRVEMLRDVFVVLYERSCERYQAVRRDMAEPDPIRLTYRPQLLAVVQAFVADERAPDRASVLAWAAGHDVPGGDSEAFAETALDLLAGLHEGSVSRYGLRPSQLRAWRARIG